MVKLDTEKFPGMKVLMVDDTSTNLNILGHILNLSGLDVSVALDMKKVP
jgi:PleD family two-component response regulator